LDLSGGQVAVGLFLNEPYDPFGFVSEKHTNDGMQRQAQRESDTDGQIKSDEPLYQEHQYDRYEKKGDQDKREQ